MKRALSLKHLAPLLVFALMSCFLLAQTKDENAISSARLIALPNPNFYLDVLFTNDLSNTTGELTPSNVYFQNTVPSPLTPALAVYSVNPLGGTPNGAEIVFSSSPPALISALQVCFHNVTFLETSGARQTVHELCGAVQIVTPDNAVSEKAKIAAALAAVPKTNSQKNIFASGFVTTASAGTQGGMDLNLNSNDLGIKGMTASLQTKKSSVPGGDPQNFQVGLNFENAYVFGGNDLDKARDDLAILRNSTAPNRDAASQDYANRITSLQKRMLSAVVVNFSGTLEGGATSFNVVNYVGDGDVALQSRTNRLFGSRKGFWQFRIVPFGVEGGKNVQDSLPTTATGSTTTKTEDAVARLKGGATFSLFYDDANSVLPFKRIELNLGTVQRYLFFKEAEILSANAVPVYRDGYRPWYQADLALYLAEASSGRYGFRLSYINGSLPPNFAIAKSFQFGFVYATADDSKQKK